MSKRSNLEREANPQKSSASRTIVIVVTLLIVAGMVTGVAGLTLRANNADQRNVSEAPRYIDIWAIYPDDSVRFMSLFYGVEGSESDTVQVAGPLIPEPSALIEVTPFGGSITNEVINPGPAHNSDQFYNLYDLARNGSGDPYGINVLSSKSPYVVLSTGLDANERNVALGTIRNDYYRQVIVAVAFPSGTDILGTIDLTPYRSLTIGGWDVYYFDTTDASGERAIRISYTRLPDEAHPEPDAHKIDRRR